MPRDKGRAYAPENMTEFLGEGFSKMALSKTFSAM
jgi:hypothetical protein